MSKLDKYPIPKIDDLFAQPVGGKRFTKLHMSQAYQQLVLEEDSRKYVVINTHGAYFGKPSTFRNFICPRDFSVNHGEPPQWHSRVDGIH